MSKNCMGCGASVSNSFARVFGNESNKVHRCLSCADSDKNNDGEGRKVLFHGGGAVEDLDSIDYF